MTKLPVHINQRIAWWQKARFGMFIHWGLYTATHQDCWKMYDMGTPVMEYAEHYVPRLNGHRFNARQLAALAKRAGCQYLVMGARHHEGYCLWETATTKFSSTFLGPHRDFIAEYVEAARGAGLGVGIYYSLLDWRYQSYWDGPRKDPTGWRAFVDLVHEQVRELMTRYGRIDILWYDGGWGERADAWGFTATPEQLAEFWRSRELNRMVRKLQSGILINNRACLPEDFGTPEKDIVPEARPWELCDTLGFYWGASRYDLDRKTVRHLIHRLCCCVARNGNMLLNIGLREDGTTMPWQQQTLEQIGKWLQRHGTCIYGCNGEWQRPFNNALSPWCTTRRGNKLYLIMLRYPGPRFELANMHDYHLTTARVVTTGHRLRLVHEPTRDLVVGLPAQPPDPMATVVEIMIRPKTRSELAARQGIGLRDPDAFLARTGASGGQL